MDQSVIDLIIDELTKHSEISYRRPNANELEIFGTPTHGFDITLHIGIRENMLLFDQFHWHYDNTEEEINEMLNQITYALFGYIRIKEFSKNKHPYKWILQVQDQEGNWCDDQTMGKISKFFGKPDIRYFQNMFLTKDADKSNSYSLPSEDNT